MDQLRPGPLACLEQGPPVRPTLPRLGAQPDPATICVMKSQALGAPQVTCLEIKSLKRRPKEREVSIGGPRAMGLHPQAKEKPRGRSKGQPRAEASGDTSPRPWISDSDPTGQEAVVICTSQLGKLGSSSQSKLTGRIPASVTQFPHWSCSTWQDRAGDGAGLFQSPACPRPRPHSWRSQLLHTQGRTRGSAQRGVNPSPQSRSQPPPPQAQRTCRKNSNVQSLR